MFDFGTDISALSDLHFAQKSAQANLGEALARRLMTPRGGLFYDPSYGFDVRQYLNAVNTQANQFELETLSAAQCQLDERVQSASVTVLTLDERSAQLQVQVTTPSGPFSFDSGRDKCLSGGTAWQHLTIYFNLPQQTPCCKP